MSDIVNKCSTECNGHKVENYPKESQDNQLDVNDLETTDVIDELENLENIVRFMKS